MSSRTTNILLIDDDPAIHGVLAVMLDRCGWVMRSAHDLPEAEEFARGGDEISVVLLDRSIAETDGLDLIPRLASIFRHAPVVLVTSSSTTDVAVEAMRRGAFDFLPKPVDEARLVATVTKAIEHSRLLRRVALIDEQGAASTDAFEGIIGSSPAMSAAFQILRHVGPTDVTVMITGESGTGKELVARAVHRLSPRAAGSFVPLNMAALPRELVEATLFGHEKGAFTGADRRREGAAGQAQGGTLFLDEIGEMPLELQTKLLRFLQERVYRPVGANEDVRADVRIVSATNREPLTEVQAGRLRADLYYRLAVVPVMLPPLRHRPGDVELIATHALRVFAQRYGKSFESIEPAALARLAGYVWPGNVRELVHLVERTVVLNDGPRFTAAMLPPEIGHPPVPTATTSPATDTVPQARTSPDAGLHTTPALHSAPAAGDSSSGVTSRAHPDEIVPLAELERRAVEHALRVCNGSATTAAQRLGMSTATIYRKIKEWGLSPRAGL
jgi:two-component system repressor protein LuxO